jgi:hypothetical protein
MAERVLQLSIVSSPRLRLKLETPSEAGQTLFSVLGVKYTIKSLTFLNNVLYYRLGVRCICIFFPAESSIYDYQGIFHEPIKVTFTVIVCKHFDFGNVYNMLMYVVMHVRV